VLSSGFKYDVSDASGIAETVDACTKADTYQYSYEFHHRFLTLVRMKKAPTRSHGVDGSSTIIHAATAVVDMSDILLIGLIDGAGQQYRCQIVALIPLFYGTDRARL
jgi:hypothetical protein